MSKSRRRFSREFKLQILNEIAAGKTIAQVSREHDIHETLICKWKKEYGKSPQGTVIEIESSSAYDSRIAELERMVGRLTMENDYLKRIISQQRAVRR